MGQGGQQLSNRQVVGGRRRALSRGDTGERRAGPDTAGKIGLLVGGNECPSVAPLPGWSFGSNETCETGQTRWACGRQNQHVEVPNTRPRHTGWRACRRPQARPSQSLQRNNGERSVWPRAAGGGGRTRLLIDMLHRVEMLHRGGQSTRLLVGPPNTYSRRLSPKGCLLSGRDHGTAARSSLVTRRDLSRPGH